MINYVDTGRTYTVFCEICPFDPSILSKTKNETKQIDLDELFYDVSSITITFTRCVSTGLPIAFTRCDSTELLIGKVTDTRSSV